MVLAMVPGLYRQYQDRKKKRKQRLGWNVTMNANMIPHGRNFNALAAAGAFDHGQQARIDGCHVVDSG